MIETYQPFSNAPISPISDCDPRPLWSVMIPTYNCANYLRETLVSVLEQDPGPDVMQIEVIDDHSTEDDPEAVVKELGSGRVNFYRQPQNVGLIKNFQTCLERARGHLIHQLHGDDKVLYGFYKRMQQLFKMHPEIGAAFCRHIHMDEQGNWFAISPLERPESGILPNWLEQIAVLQRIQTPSIVVRRDVYEKLGGFDCRLSSSEDWEMWIRIATNYAFGYEPMPLALYRRHSNSNTRRKVKTGENIQDVRKLISIVKDYLPKERAQELQKAALENCAIDALNIADALTQSGDTSSALNQIREALKCSHSLRVLKSSIKRRLTLLYLDTLRKIDMK